MTKAMTARNERSTGSAQGDDVAYVQHAETGGVLEHDVPESLSALLYSLGQMDGSPSQPQWDTISVVYRVFRQETGLLQRESVLRYLIQQVEAGRMAAVTLLAFVINEPHQRPVCEAVSAYLGRSVHSGSVHSGSVHSGSVQTSSDVAPGAGTPAAGTPAAGASDPFAADRDILSALSRYEVANRGAAYAGLILFGNREYEWERFWPPYRSLVPATLFDVVDPSYIERGRDS